MYNAKTPADRELARADWSRKLQDWYGVVVKIPARQERERVKDGLDALLQAHGHLPTINGGVSLACRGAYSPSMLDEIKAYFRSHRVKPHIVKKEYDDLLGRDWIETLTKQRR